MKAKIVKLNDFLVVGMKCKTSEKENTEKNVIPKLWDQFMQRYSEIKNVSEENVSYGVCPSDLHPEEFTEDLNFEYIAALPVSSNNEIPEGMISFLIEGGKYAMFEHVGNLDSLGKTYEHIYSEGAVENGIEFRTGSELEKYGERFKLNDVDSILEIYIPIK